MEIMLRQINARVMSPMLISPGACCKSEPLSYYFNVIREQSFAIYGGGGRFLFS